MSGCASMIERSPSRRSGCSSTVSMRIRAALVGIRAAIPSHFRHSPAEPREQWLPAVNKSDVCRNGKFDFGAVAGTTPEFKTRADLVGAFAHTDKTPVAIEAGLKDTGVDSNAVIGHRQKQTPKKKKTNQQEKLCARMTENKQKRHTRNPVRLVTQERSKRSLRTFYD